MTADRYEIVIGLEVHAQLNTKSKLFCADSTAFGAEPNTQVSVISLGHPGTLPKLNSAAIELAIRLGLACHCDIVQHNYFARKNYFYPDLPKGYQISQHTTPICKNGYLIIKTNGTEKKIRLNRIHIEEDAGKSLHSENSNFSNIDFNRAGMPLLEIVTEPDIRSAEEAFTYVTNLRQLVRHLNVCDGNMEEGSLRCDVNISVRLKGDNQLGTKVEIKNLNSIRFIKKAIEYESARLIELHASELKIVQETRGFNENDQCTYSIRLKEDEDDYRYFPEPDLPPFYISDELLESVRKSIPPLPEEMVNYLINIIGLSEYDAKLISENNELYNFYLKIIQVTTNYKAAANFTVGPIKNYFSEHGSIPFTSKSIADIISKIDDGNITFGIAIQKIIPILLKNSETSIEQIIYDQNLDLKKNNFDIDESIEKTLVKHAEKIKEYKNGKKGLLSLFVGEVMKMSKGKADANLVTEKIIEKLKT